MSAGKKIKKLSIHLVALGLFFSTSCSCYPPLDVHSDYIPFNGSLSAEGVSSSMVDLHWSMPLNHRNAKIYNIYRDGSYIGNTVSYFYSDASLSSDTTYVYRVCAGDGTAELECTGLISASTYPEGNVFYVDPVNGSMANDGSYDLPWSTLEDVFDNDFIEMKVYTDLPYDGNNEMEIINEGAPVKGGDTIVLRDGYHGEIFVRGAYNDKYITIRAQAGHNPVLSGIVLSAASHWRLEGLTITEESAPVFEQRTLVEIESHGWHGPADSIIVKDCNVSSIDDATSWNATQWDTLSCNGIMGSGTNLRVNGNYLRNVNFGICIDGRFSLVSDNVIENFAGDGMRGNANDMVFEYNTVKNCYAVNANHDDGFQSFSVNGAPPRERVVLRGNTIINREDPDQPLQGSLQGIGCFDGLYIDWIVENNLVVVDHWHGISFYGAINCRIVNNTVVNPYSDRQTWIMFTEHKNGTLNKNCLIRNNITEQVNTSFGVTEDHNILIPDDYSMFVDPSSFDFHLKPGSPAIDSGTAELAPDIDIEGVGRPLGSGTDRGAYECY